MYSEQVEKFVRKNKFLIQSINLEPRCIDDRPAVSENLERLPAISKPGADIGDVMIMLATLNELQVNMPSQEVLDLVMSVYGGPEKLKFHTDSDCEEKSAGPGAGCGHINRATLDPVDYLLNPEQMVFIKATLPNLLEQGAKQVVLAGKHDADAVVVLNSELYGIKPYDDQFQVFNYHQTLHQKQLDKLAQPFAQKLAALDQEIHPSKLRKVIHNIFQKQLSTSLEKLAKGLPKYEAHIDNWGWVTVQVLQ